MADNVQVNVPISSGAIISADDIGSGVVVQRVKTQFGVDGSATDVSAANPLPVTDAAAETSLASILAKLSSDPATQTTLAAILAKLSADPATQTTLASILLALQGVLTVTGTVNANTGLSQPLTDTQLRATPVPVSGTVTATPTGTQNVDVTANTIGLATGTKQDAQTALLTTIDGDTSNLDVALSTRNLEATQLLVKAKTDNLDVLLSTRTKPSDQQHTIVDSGTLTAVTAITNALPAGNNNIGDVDVASIAAGTNIIGKVGIDQTTPGTTNKVNIGSDGVVQANAGTNLNTSLLALESGGNLAAIAASASVLDDWDETDRAKVNLIVGQAGVSANDGNTDAGTQRVVIAANVLSTNNSSTAPLAANAIFTGTSDEIISYNEARISVYSDVASAIDGLSIQQSTDNSNWVIVDTYTIAAATGKTFSVPRQARYFRIVYTNGGTAQATFILQISYSRIAAKSSSQRASDNYTNETDLEQQQSFLMNYNQSTGTWYRVRGDSVNGLAVNPNGFNVDYQRKMQEQQVLYAYSTLMEELGATERYNSSRDFIEIR